MNIHLYEYTQTTQERFIWIYIYVCRKNYKIILIYCQREIWQNVYPQPNRIPFIFGSYSLSIDSIPYSYPHTIRFDSKSEKNMVTNTVSLLSIHIRSVFTPIHEHWKQWRLTIPIRPSHFSREKAASSNRLHRAVVSGWAPLNRDNALL
jgi:hypothetical protein